SDAVPRWIQDSVCHMQIDLNQTPYRWEWQGTTWGFCTRGCLQAFKAKPEAYALVEGGFS
ncbi:MAG: YHS domain-containing protein, partial [Sulfobacillus sp.]|nr:YHS domain-containing protein [Sulfobacillus sp.]